MQQIKFFGSNVDLTELEETLKNEGIEHERTMLFVRNAEASFKEVIMISSAALVAIAKIAQSFFANRKRKFKFTSGRGIVEIQNPTEEEVQKALKMATAVYLSDNDGN